MGGRMGWVRLCAAGLALASVVSIAGMPSRASACGGCFVPPGKETGAVGAHRMAITVRGNETILWDQIVYDGAPEDFVWVLPVAAGIEVELADNAFFEALSLASRLRLDGPLVCAPGATDVASVTSPVGYEAGPIARPTDLPPDAEMRDVHVTAEAVVGPYETVTISGDVTELVSWLVERGYLVPEAFIPILADYAARGMSFAVLRLAPGEGVDRMQPVRVRLPGVGASLPLRMVAAGVVTTVDLELFVIGEGRYEVSGFGNAEVDRTLLAYDVATLRFNYQQLFDAALYWGTGVSTNWVTEHAAPLDVPSLRAYRSLADGVMRTAEADVDIAVADLDAPYLTRLRTRLPPSELERDLTVRVSSGGDLVGPVAVTLALNEDPSPCAPRDAARPDAGPRALPTPRACGCGAVRRDTSGLDLGVLGALSVIALGWFGRRRSVLRHRA